MTFMSMRELRQMIQSLQSNDVQSYDHDDYVVVVRCYYPPAIEGPAS